MKVINFFCALVVVVLTLNSTTTFSSSAGSVIAVTYTGLPLAIDIAVCTNVNDPITCEKHTTTSNQIILTPVAKNFYYKYMGFKILTPGYIVQSTQGTLTPNRYGYVLTPGSASAPVALQIGETVPTCNGLTAINLNGVNWRCYDLPENSRVSCMLPPKNNCVVVAATVPTFDEINTLYAEFSVANSQNLFSQATNAAITNMPYNPFFGGSVLLVNTPASLSAASWSTDWGTTNFIVASQQLCPCTV